MIDLKALCLVFLNLLNQQNIYDSVATCPTISIVPLVTLQNIACDGATCPVEAFYDREDKTIFLSELLELEYALHRSILLHELVHYAQDISGKLEQGENECLSGMRRELYAFRIQEKYLLQQNIHIPVSQQMAFYRC